MSDTNPPEITDVMTLINGDQWRFSVEVPDAFRHLVDRKRLIKMIRNADTIRLYMASMGEQFITPQKGDLITVISNSMEDDEFALCIFNGLDLQIIGIIDEVKDDD